MEIEIRLTTIPDHPDAKVELLERLEDVVSALAENGVPDFEIIRDPDGRVRGSVAFDD